jgi:hypothetical protein
MNYFFHSKFPIFFYMLCTFILYLSLLSVLSCDVAFNERAGAVAAKDIPEIPAIYRNLAYDQRGNLFLKYGDEKVYLKNSSLSKNLEQIRGNPQGTKEGILFDFDDLSFTGNLYFACIDYANSLYPNTLYYHEPLRIIEGKALLPLQILTENFCERKESLEKGFATILYRIVDHKGNFLHEATLNFTVSDKCVILPAIITGPFINLVTHNTCGISFHTNMETIPEVWINNKIWQDTTPAYAHEFHIEELTPATAYTYEIRMDTIRYTYSFKTAPAPGSRKAFSFAFASGSGKGQGGGERDMYGVNYSLMRRIMALAALKNVSFLQFAANMITPDYPVRRITMLQYANWKKSLEPFAHYFPVITTMGYKDRLQYLFSNNDTFPGFSIDPFPFATESAEALFADIFVHPENGPLSEDGASYDPDPLEMDFPPYQENVFYYIYGNAAFIVLNTSYLYSNARQGTELFTGGNISGYLMDKQIEWLGKLLENLEKNRKVDHVFLTHQAPVFPVGPDLHQAMWYGGNNQVRPWINGKPLKKGILERRDEYLDLIINKSSKVRAILCGESSHYHRLKINDAMPRYPQGWDKEKIKLRRSIYQINSGNDGFFSCLKEKAPWYEYIEFFTRQNTLVFFHLRGRKIFVEVIHPDTLETLDEWVLH